MGTYDALVRRALSDDQKDLIDHEEHCSAEAGQLAAVGAALGQQIRIRRTEDQYALYTVSEVRPETPGTVVRMGEDGRERLGKAHEFAGVLDTDITRSELTDEQARCCSEFVERLHDNGTQSNLIVLAPHGGDIEVHTDEQAEHIGQRLGSRRASVWLCKGFRRGGGASARWHITSDDIDPASFPALGTVFGRGFTDAVSFHGFTHEDTDDAIVIGGAADDRLKGCIATKIGAAVAGSGLTVRIAQDGDPLGGTKPGNIVNRITAAGRGIQIEQAPAAREHFALAIAEAVADVYAARSRRGGLGGAPLY